jgi:hypothetical protein
MYGGNFDKYCFTVSGFQATSSFQFTFWSLCAYAMAGTRISTDIHMHSIITLMMEKVSSSEMSISIYHTT